MLRYIVINVDGVLTDGSIYISEDGHDSKRFFERDCYGIRKALEHNFIIVLISRTESNVVEKFAQKLNIQHVLQGVNDKKKAIEDFCRSQSSFLSEFAYIGDDVNDIPALRIVNLSACPSDASGEVRGMVKYVCHKEGGRGCAREFIDHIIMCS
ncbi:MAG: HAD hydrolase family protein [Bacilli bacterium]|nr:HAD hydrolase family protein [Bacilli bacterium]